MVLSVSVVPVLDKRVGFYFYTVVIILILYFKG